MDWGWGGREYKVKKQDFDGQETEEQARPYEQSIKEAFTGSSQVPGYLWDPRNNMLLHMAVYHPFSSLSSTVYIIS